ncbi:hypothetical protein CQW23_28303 [Capsicum baccatum]|uniref:Ubiquitin-like protease family profile domain-containing protein n=1 Tax=Capsicum baccatum TaxID=33114 RepID=A0A2G2VG61_CAPBA|nr:hypothetical protein CQW23_28303 [Capsicum baccatum]
MLVRKLYNNLEIGLHQKPSVETCCASIVPTARSLYNLYQVMEQNIGPIEPPSSRRRYDDLDDEMGEELGLQCCRSNDFDSYLSQDRENIRDETGKQQLLSWWKTQIRQFAKLSRMVRDLLSAQASSVASEQAFSAGRFIIGDHRESCFGKYLDLPEDNNARFQMKMVYDLLKPRFMYENKDKMDEVWINYCGMPVYFGWEEFAIVTRLKCYPPSPSQVIPTLTQKKVPRIPKKEKRKSSDRDDLVSIIGPRFKNKNLIEALKDFTASSECCLYKYQDCKAKHDGVINAINALTASVKKMISKRGVIPSKRILYPDTPLEIKTAKRRRKDTSKASSIIKKSKIATPLSLSCTDVQYSRATEEQHELKKHIDVIFYYLLNKAKLQIQEQYRYIPGNCLYKVYINNAYDRYCQQQPEVSRNEECLINIIKGVSIPSSLSWHLVDEVYIPINYGNEFHWVLAFVVLKERRIRVYDSMLRRRCSKPLSAIQKLDKILPTYLDMSGFLDQKVRIDWLTIEAYRDKIANPFDVQYVDGISQQTIGSL